MIYLKYLNASVEIPTITNVIMVLVVLSCLFWSIYRVIKNKNFHKTIISDSFWIAIPWLLCLFLYFCLGITYKIKLDIIAFIYIFVFWCSYALGKYIAHRISKKKETVDNKGTLKDQQLKLKFDKKMDFNKLFFLSLISVIVYIILIYVYNPGMTFGITRNISRNYLTTIFHILSSASLVIWLYELIYYLIEKQKMRYYAIPCAIIYNLPGIAISGRDALMIFIISTLIIVIYSICFMKKYKKVNNKMSAKKKVILSVFLLLIIAYVFLISSTRYGQSSDGIVNLFKMTTGAKFPKYLLILYNNTGIIGKFMLNLVFYFSSQFSKFALIFNEYKGPYQFGLHQLHYVARLIPGFNSDAVTQSIQTICTNNNLPGLRSFWDTFIGYSIMDFGRVGSIIYSFVLGFLVEKVSIKCRKRMNPFDIIVLVMICVGMFITIEISPIYDYFYIFPFAWLILIMLFMKKKEKIHIINKHKR